MFIYLVARTGHTRYDENLAHVVIAPDERTARQMCSDHAADEGSACWLDPAQSTVKVIDASQASGIVLSSFNAG